MDSADEDKLQLDALRSYNMQNGKRRDSFRSYRSSSDSSALSGEQDTLLAGPIPSSLEGTHYEHSKTAWVSACFQHFTIAGKRTVEQVLPTREPRAEDAAKVPSPGDDMSAAVQQEPPQRQFLMICMPGKTHTYVLHQKEMQQSATETEFFQQLRDEYSAKRVPGFVPGIPPFWRRVATINCVKFETLSVKSPHWVQIKDWNNQPVGVQGWVCDPTGETVDAHEMASIFNGPVDNYSNISSRVPRKLDSPLLPVLPKPFETGWGLCLSEEWKPWCRVAWVVVCGMVILGTLWGIRTAFGMKLTNDKAPLGMSVGGNMIMVAAAVLTYLSSK